METGNDRFCRLAKPVPGFTAFVVKITVIDGAAVFTILRAKDPIVTCGVCWDKEAEQESWGALCKMHEQVQGAMREIAAQTGAPEHKLNDPMLASSVPWLAAATLPHIANQNKENIGWLADFERCLAWTIIEMARESQA